MNYKKSPTISFFLHGNIMYFWSLNCFNMNNNYFSLPLNTKSIITNKEHHKCTIKESISHFIHLITTSYFGECTFDDSFGCAIWDVDFDNLSSVNRIKSIIMDSLFDSLKNHEKRLVNVAIDVNIRQEELLASKKGSIVKKKVSIKIAGKVKKTNEDFLYKEYFYIGPLSY